MMQQVSTFFLHIWKKSATIGLDYWIPLLDPIIVPDNLTWLFDPTIRPDYSTRLLDPGIGPGYWTRLLDPTIGPDYINLKIPLFIVLVKYISGIASLFIRFPGYSDM
jgi:hypothetical protein